MGFRFRKSIKILPGIRLNLSKSGVSASIGKPGATVNISDRGTRGTVGIPGSGLSYSQKLDGKPVAAPQHAAPAKRVGSPVFLLLLVLLGAVLLFMVWPR